MKFLPTLIAILCFSAGLLASLEPIDVVMLTDPTSGTSVLRSTIPVSRATRLELVSARGTSLYRSAVDQGSYFNLRLSADYLPTGKYILFISDERGRTLLPFAYRNGSLEYQPAEGVRTIFPDFDLREGRQLIVNYPVTEGPDLQVSLVNAEGDEVFTDSQVGDAPTRKAYQLSALSAGTYTFTVSTARQQLHTQTLRLD